MDVDVDCQTKYRPSMVDCSKPIKVLPEGSEPKSGDLIRMSIKLIPYQVGGAKGVAAQLQAVQLVENVISRMPERMTSTALMAGIAPTTRSKMTTSSSREFFFPVEPVPASRPRVSRWGTYYGKRYEKFRKDMREVLRPIDLEPLAGDLEVTIEFIVSPPKTTKRTNPVGDIDNFIKGPLDSMTRHGGF